MRWNVLARPVSLVLVTAGLFVVLGLGGSGPARACSPIAAEPVEFVTGLLTGEAVEGSGTRTNVGRIVAVVDREAILVWDAVPGFSAASASVVARYWGVAPRDSTFDPQIRGGEPIPSSYQPGGGECPPTIAQPLGSHEFVAIIEPGLDVPLLESELTRQQEAILTEFLGESIWVDPPELPAQHPQADATPTATPPVTTTLRATGPVAQASGAEGARSGWPWILAALGAVGFLGLVAWGVMRTRSDDAWPP